MPIPARACSRKGKGDVAEDKTQSENAYLSAISDVARSASGTRPGIGDVAMAKRHLRHTKRAISGPISERGAKTFLKHTFRGPPGHGRKRNSPRERIPFINFRRRILGVRGARNEDRPSSENAEALRVLERTRTAKTAMHCANP